MAVSYYDVIVVGGGNAALCAALSAHEQGARVAILEAAPRRERGGNSRFASTVFRFPHRGLQDLEPLLCEEAKPDLKLCSIGSYTPEMFIKDMMETSDGRTDMAQVQVAIEQGLPTVQWMRDLGVEFQTTVRKFIDEKVIREKNVITIAPGIELMVKHEGVGLTDNLWAAVEKTDIQTFYSCPATDLIADGDKILGVKTRQADKFIDFFGNVVLACGGFEASPRLRRQYLGEGWDLVVVRGTRFNTGTMLEKAIAAGAQATGHWGSAHASPQDINAPKMGDLKYGDKMSRYSYPYAIMVNVLAKRFLDEGENNIGLTYAKTGAAISAQPQGRAFQIFDQKTIGLLEPRYSTGTPITDDTLAGLAKKLGINPNVFEDTVAKYNAATKPGKFNPLILDGLATDDSIAIPKSNWAQPIDKAPYTAYPVICGITFTYGGVKINTTAQVLNNEGQTMEGLYAAGEMSGGYFYHNYPGGAGLVKGSVFGKIAGKAAAERAKAESTRSRSQLEAKL